MKELTTSQVAERFNVSASNVRVWCRRGLLAGAREEHTERGPVWRIPEGALVGFTPPKRTGRPPKPKPADGAGKAKRARKKRGE